MIKKWLLFVHYGCKVNQYETNAMMQLFIEKGFEIVDFSDKADIYVVNTCTVTNMADKKSRQMFHKVKEKNKNSILAVVGCYAQVAKQELEKVPEIDLILGVNEKKDIVEYVEKYINKKHESVKAETINEKDIYEMKSIAVSDVLHQKEFVDFGTVTYSQKTRAVIKIQDGCDRYCSYCLIPYARGRVRSRNAESILEEVRANAQNGIKEVVITGIHIASYGKDLKNEGYCLINLLEDMNKIEGIERIRLGSIEPNLITESFAKRLSKLEKVCNHFHLSLQSGCNETLKRMNRKYTVEEFENITNILRKYYKNVILTTDIIVGFPGETEDEFKKTYEFLKKIKFYKMHVFKYSPRKGTKAAKMENQIDGNTKEIRSKKLIDLSNENEKTYNERYIGEYVKVLLEEECLENGYKYIKGHTSNYIVVKIKQNNIKNNNIVNCKIIDIDGNELIGETV